MNNIEQIDAVVGMVNVVYGVHDIDMPLADFTVEQVQFALRDQISVEMSADAFVGGWPASPTYRLRPGDRMEFFKRWGRKGVGKTWTKTEFMQTFHMSDADWTDWRARGLPFDTMRDGTIILNETEVDEWKHAQRGQKTNPTKRAEANKLMLSLKDAAACMGMTVSGLRKLVDKREVRYCQRKPHSAVMFRREWLDEYIAKHTIVPRDEAPSTRPSKRRTRKKLAGLDNGQDNPHGFRWAMRKQ